VKDKAFRLDFFIAIGALVVSGLTEATLAYQTHVIGDQYAATVWPYLSVDATYGMHGVTISLGNEGLGPALVQSAQLSVDGKAVPGWASFAHALYVDPKLHRLFRKGMTLSMSSIDGSTTIPAGTTKTVFAVVFPDLVPNLEASSHGLAIDLCYCSLNGSCWLAHSAPGQGKVSQRAHVAACTSTAAINADYNAPARLPTRKE
jgi:hypothetical protein